jgi:tetratricopeptide (TPR) repeat protein
MPLTGRRQISTSKTRKHAAAHQHNNLGVALAAQGNVADAMVHYRRALLLSPDHVDAHSNLGMALTARGRIDEAVTHCRSALRLDPNHAGAHHNLGVALAAQGRIDDALAHYERAVALSPDNTGARYDLAQALRAKGRMKDAAGQFERVLMLNPGHTGAHYNLGVALTAQGSPEGAASHYERLLVLNPNHAEAHNNLAIILNEQGRSEEAVAHFRRSLALNPDHPFTHNNLGIALATQGRIGDAIAHYERALILKPDHADAHNNLGFALATEGRMEDSMPHYLRALAINPDHAEAHNNLGCLYKEEGRFEEATEHYERAIAIRPDYGEAHMNRADIKTFAPGDADVTALEALAGRDNLSTNNKLYVNFAAAKALEDSGNYPRAFEHLRKGNALRRRQVNYDEMSNRNFFQRISAVFDSSLFHRFEGQGDPSTIPVFVLGMPRSGSSLIEQILASHPQIQGAGERKDLEIAASGVFTAQYPECVPDADGDSLRRIARAYLDRLPAAADGKVRITDKAPGNFRHIGLIRLIFPNARIIHTVRDPIDTCVSCYSKLFRSGLEFSYDLAELGRYYRWYEELMTHWRSVVPPDAILDVSYEELVDDVEGQARRLIDYCGLPWDDNCLSFHRNSRPVRTASSVQVRKPLFRSSLQRWRRYEAELAPLLDELAPSLLTRVAGA